MQLPKHLQVFEGALWDNRKPSGNQIVREKYAWHFREISQPWQVLSCLRAGEFAWPGGYRVWFLASDGAALSFAAVKENLRSVLESTRDRDSSGWGVIGLICASECEEMETCSHTGEILFNPEA